MELHGDDVAPLSPCTQQGRKAVNAMCRPRSHTCDVTGAADEAVRVVDGTEPTGDQQGVLRVIECVPSDLGNAVRREPRDGAVDDAESRAGPLRAVAKEQL